LVVSVYGDVVGSVDLRNLYVTVRPMEPWHERLIPLYGGEMHVWDAALLREVVACVQEDDPAMSEVDATGDAVLKILADGGWPSQEPQRTNIA
jgi:hypothetical protein